MKRILAVVSICVVVAVVYGYVQVKQAFAQKFELETEAALAHGETRYLLTTWLDKLDLTEKRSQLVSAKSAHAMMMAGEEFLLIYPKDTIMLDENDAVEVEEGYRLRSAIPGTDVVGKRFALTERVGDCGFVEVIKTEDADVLYVYMGDG